jgi:ribonuclease-3
MKNNQNRINELKDLAQKINITFSDLNTFDIALTHRSYINESESEQSVHNERLEFLGDAVLELISSEYLFKEYPNRPEGELTSFRSAAVRTESLAEIARELGFGDFLRMSKGEAQTGGRNKDYLLANCFEAVIGSIYIDQGMEKAKDFIFRYLIVKIPAIVENRLDIDNKSKFQEIAQAILKQTPHYKVLKEDGPDHEKQFTVGIFVNEEPFGEGTGASKQKAEENAAKDALEKCLLDKRFITA